MELLFRELLEHSSDKIENVEKRLDYLGKMFLIKVDKHLKPKFGGFIYDDSIEIYTCYQDETMTITFGRWKLANVEFPDHSHKDSKEFLIASKGSFVVKFPHGLRYISKGECAYIPMGVSHSVTSLEDDSIMLGICIPPEQAYLRDKVS